MCQSPRTGCDDNSNSSLYTPRLGRASSHCLIRFFDPSCVRKMNGSEILRILSPFVVHKPLYKYEWLPTRVVASYSCPAQVHGNEPSRPVYRSPYPIAPESTYSLAETSNRHYRGIQCRANLRQSICMFRVPWNPYRSVPIDLCMVRREFHGCFDNCQHLRRQCENHMVLRCRVRWPIHDNRNSGEYFLVQRLKSVCGGIENKKKSNAKI